MSKLYKGHTITLSKVSRDVWRICFGKPYLATVDLYEISGPVVNVDLSLRAPVSIAAAKRLINQAITKDTV